jgi:transposase InsO family protein
MERFLKPERFDGGTDTSWPHWKKTFENFLSSFDTKPTEEQKLHLLTNFMATTAYNHISECTTYADAIDILAGVYDKRTNEIFARHKLATLKQSLDENIDQFLQNLKLAAKDCHFKAVTSEEYRSEAIRDAFITGLRSPVIRQRLLENDSLSLDDAVRLARALDTAQRNSEVYATSNAFVSGVTASIQMASSTPQCASLDKEHGPEIPDKEQYNCNSVVGAISRRKCFFCGRSYHRREQCPARNERCNNCHKAGHFAVVCKSARNKVSASTNTNILCSVPGISPPASVCLPIEINDNNLNAMIDSGSCSSFMHPKTAERLGIQLLPSKERISMASSPHFQFTLGHANVQLKVNDHSYAGFKISVLPDLCYEVILGQDFMKLHKQISFQFQGSEQELLICGVSTMTVNPPTLFPHLTPDCRPITTPTRNYSSQDRSYIKDEIRSLLKDGIIEKSNSPWRAQVLVTQDDRHRKRMVVDYSATINRFTLLDAYPLPRINSLVHDLAKFKYFSKIDLKSAYYQIPLRDDEKAFTAFEADGQLYHFTRVPFGLTNSVAAFQRIMRDLIAENDIPGTFSYLDDILICGRSQEEHDLNLSKFKQLVSRNNLTLNESKCQYSQTVINYLGYTISNGSLQPDSDRLDPLRNLPAPTDAASLRRALGLFAYYSHWIQNFSDKIAPLLQENSFPMSDKSLRIFSDIKEDICSASLAAFDECLPVEVETDASNTSIAGCMSQNGRPVAFFSRTLTARERLQPSVEREATAIVESVRKWRNFLVGRKFIIITDQQAVSFMFDQNHCSKIKNNKILRWRMEMCEYQYEIRYRPGKLNFCADTLSRACTLTISSLAEIHEGLCHPGVTRLNHFIKSRNLPYSLNEVREICSQCTICAEIKPRFFRPPRGQLIQASRPYDRISIDFVGPKESVTKNKYLLVMVDEFSRFPFVYPCADITAKTVIACLLNLFCLFGCPASIHSDRGAQFMSKEVNQFLMGNGVAMTHSTPYHPIGNGQCERYNGIIWRTVKLALRSRNLSDVHWESVLGIALHSVRSLLCTSTNESPHSRFFSFSRRSSSGYSFPDWLKPGPVLLRKFVRNSKSDPLVEPVDLISVSPHYARVRYQDGREASVSTSDLAPSPEVIEPPSRVEIAESKGIEADAADTQTSPVSDQSLVNADAEKIPSSPHLRRSSRTRKEPDRLSYNH